MAEVALAERTHNSLKVSWRKPTQTGLTHYYLWIDPDDNNLQLPIRIDKYVLFSKAHLYMIDLCDMICLVILRDQSYQHAYCYPSTLTAH